MKRSEEVKQIAAELVGAVVADKPEVASVLVARMAGHVAVALCLLAERFTPPEEATPPSE
jgi:hypothetical protein